jgi:hypothetical protein
LAGSNGPDLALDYLALDGLVLVDLVGDDLAGLSGGGTGWDGFGWDALGRFEQRRACRNRRHGRGDDPLRGGRSGGGLR